MIMVSCNFEKSISRLADGERVKPKWGVASELEVVKQEVVRLKTWVDEAGKDIAEGLVDSNRKIEKIESAMKKKSKKHSERLQVIKNIFNWCILSVLVQYRACQYFENRSRGPAKPVQGVIASYTTL